MTVSAELTGNSIFAYETAKLTQSFVLILPLCNTVWLVAFCIPTKSEANKKEHCQILMLGKQILILRLQRLLSENDFLSSRSEARWLL